MRAALGAGDGMHLVDDHCFDAVQGLARRAGEQQEERLGSSDQDVGRLGGELAPLLSRGVAGAQTHRDVGLGQTEPGCRMADTGERRAQVSLHVDGKGLQRTDVQHAAAPHLVGRRRGAGQSVQGPQEGCQRLARPGRCYDQGMPAAGDRRPSSLLRRRRCRERRREPRPGGGGEPVEGAGGHLVCHIACHVAESAPGV